MRSARASTSAGWRWIPTLYFAQGLAYVCVTGLSVVAYKNLGVSNTDIALYTSWLYLPWVVKPVWSPFVDRFCTKRRWIIAMQGAIAACCAALAFAWPLAAFFAMTLAMFWLLAIVSATHDIAADGYYMLAQPTSDQAAFAGVRSVFFRVALIAGQGGLVYLAGVLIEQAHDAALAWSVAFGIVAIAFVVLVSWHRAMLPTPDSDRPVSSPRGSAAHFRESFAAFFRRPDIGLVLAFLLTFRLGEAQGLKLVAPFLLDPRSAGGLELSTADVGLVYGTIGVIALTAGGLAGGYAISRNGLARWLWPMLVAVHVPNLAFVYLAYAQPAELAIIATAIAIEQFGYGFGFSAYLLYMILVADRGGDNPHKTAHYAICAGFMGLGMMVPGMASGWLQSELGYPRFFVWVCVATLPSFLVAARLSIDPAFAKRPAHA